MSRTFCLFCSSTCRSSRKKAAEHLRVKCGASDITHVKQRRDKVGYVHRYENYSIGNVANRSLDTLYIKVKAHSWKKQVWSKNLPHGCYIAAVCEAACITLIELEGKAHVKKQINDIINRNRPKHHQYLPIVMCSCSYSTKTGVPVA